jgi:hypothetical protein
LPAPELVAGSSPHPATKAASINAIDHVSGLKRLLDLFMCFSCSGIPKGIGVRLIHCGRESLRTAPEF